MARKTLVEELQEQEDAKKKGGKTKKGKRDGAPKPKAERKPKEKAKAPKTPKEPGKRKALHREAKRAAEGKTIGFTRAGTKTASLVDWIGKRENGVTLEHVAKHYEITEGAAGVRLWRCVLAGKLTKVGEGRGNTRYIVA